MFFPLLSKYASLLTEDTNSQLQTLESQLPALHAIYVIFTASLACVFYKSSSKCILHLFATFL